MTAQLKEARKGNITPQMVEVSREECVSEDTLCKAVAEGKIVIPINKKRVSTCQPVGIGKGLKTKVNANIGTSPQKSDTAIELHKLQVALEAGTDAVMDLSTGDDIDNTRQSIIHACNKPVGTVPIYQVAKNCKDVTDMNIDSYLEVLEKHAEDGVDFITIHSGITRDALPLLQKRLMGVVSRGGALLTRWMRINKKENFLYKHFDRILDIAEEYDLCLSLGDGLRPGCIDDATDEAQLLELKVLGELGRRARERGVQVMIEGPGHVPIWQIKENVELEKEYCDEAPFYVLGPLPTDIAAGYDHYAGAIGGAIAAGAGVDFLCYLTPKEHIGLPDAEDVREGVVLSKIAAHIGDLQKQVPGARELDRKMSLARVKRDWEEMRQYVIDPRRFDLFLETEDKSDKCSMCGELCAMKIFQE